MKIQALLAFALFLGTCVVPAQAAVEVTPPKVVLRGVPFQVEVQDPDIPEGSSETIHITSGSTSQTVVLTGPGPVTVEGIVVESGEELVVSGAESRIIVPLRSFPGWMSLAPPLVAILLAVLFRQAVLALFTGVWLGAFLILGGGPLTSFFNTLQTYVLNAVTDPYNVMLLLFTFAMAGMLGVISRMGGTAGLVDWVAGWAHTPRSGQLATAVMGLVIFFDDYANTLMVGNTMRPITDRLRISREKLAYLVDSTAATVASLAIVSTWIGVEVGLIGEAFSAAGIERDGFSAFVESIPYRFYPILALMFVFMVASSGRDFGPMLKAERRGRGGKPLRPGSIPLADLESESLQPVPGKPQRPFNALIPVLVTVGAVCYFLYTTGVAGLEPGAPHDMKAILGAADSYVALLWASFLGAMVAFLLAVGQRILSPANAVAAWLDGAKSVFPAAIILTLAWSISAVSQELGTANFLVQSLENLLNPRFLPALVFVLAGAASFATGSSWSTMGILMPLVIPLAHELAPGQETILLGTISSVLAGAVWGDHCSPISDTTVLSSMASSVDHMDHVNTQLPYAFLVGTVAVVLGDLPSGFGAPWWVSWILGAGVLWGALRLFGKRSD